MRLLKCGRTHSKFRGGPLDSVLELGKVVQGEGASGANGCWANYSSSRAQVE